MESKCCMPKEQNNATEDKYCFIYSESEAKASDDGKCERFSPRRKSLVESACCGRIRCRVVTVQQGRRGVGGIRSGAEHAKDWRLTYL